MSETKRMRSIARRISNSFLMRSLFTLLVVNLLAISVSLLYFAFHTEKAALGSSWQANLQRRLVADDSLRGTAWLGSLRYSFALPDQPLQTVEAGLVFKSLGQGLATLLCAEAILLVFQYRGHQRRSLYLMTPLREMGKTAEQLSQVRFGEDQVHSLEDAIENLSVKTPEARLQTGDSELAPLESAINKLVGRMHESYQQQTRFVSDASHELRTPIAVIRGYADLLSRWGMDDRKVMEEAVTAIQGEADNMQRLVEQLLFLARGDAGRMSFSPEKVDLERLVQEAHEEYTLIDSGHNWRIKTQGPVLALGDEASLKQALRILADNAIKFSPAGSIITLRAFTSPQGTACFSVQDNGAGIAQQELPHIFERFYRADPARSRGGTGLGLSIAKYIAERHQGHLDVFSSLGLGTRFTFHLPAFTGTAHGKQEQQETGQAQP